MAKVVYRGPSADLFEEQNDVILCPVNCVPGVMGKGLALEFAKRFPGIKEHHAILARNRLFPGQPVLWPSVTPMVVFFPTKRHWKDRSNMEDLWVGLGSLHSILTYSEELKTLAGANPEGLCYVGVPALGCGLGGLDWGDVGPILHVWGRSLPDCFHVNLYPPRK